MIMVTEDASRYSAVDARTKHIPVAIPLDIPRPKA